MTALTLSYCLFLLLVAHARCIRTPSSSQILFDLDQFGRRTFDPSFIVPGFFNLNENDEDSSSCQSIRTIDRLLGRVKDATNIDLFPSSTGWRFIRTALRGHVDGFLVSSNAIELNYIYANSSGLMPGSAVLLRRENDITGHIPKEFTVTNHFHLFPVGLIMQKTGNGTFGFPLPFQDISNALVLGNDTFGRLTSDCSAGAPDQAVNIAGFSEVSRADCMGAVGRTSDQHNCYSANRRCNNVHCTENCCAGPWNDYYRNASCAYINLNDRHMNGTKSFSDLLLDVSSWSCDPPLGTGLQWQQAFVRAKDSMTEGNSNMVLNREAQNQLDRASDAIDLLLSRMIISAESSLSPRPTSIDLTLVCVAVLSALLAIDSITIYKAVLKSLSKLMKNKKRSRFMEDVAVVLVAMVTSSPATVTAAVIVYQETARGMLNMLRSGNGWHAELIWDNTAGENLWFIRRVMAEMTVSTSHGIRPLYILLPLILTYVDFGIEFCILFRYCRYGLMPSEITGKDNDASEN